MQPFCWHVWDRPTPAAPDGVRWGAKLGELMAPDKTAAERRARQLWPTAHHLEVLSALSWQGMSGKEQRRFQGSPPVQKFARTNAVYSVRRPSPSIELAER